MVLKEKVFRNKCLIKPVESSEQIAEKNILKVKGPLFHRKDIGTTDLIQKKLNHMSSLK